MVRTTYVLQSTPANLLIVRYFFGLSVGRYEFIRVVYQSYTSHFSGIGIIPPPLGWYRWYLLVGIAVLSMVGILVGITVQAIFYLGYFLN